MNREPDKNRTSPPWNQAVLDQLVDGELSPTEYQELLETFERNPEGWRACSLAFLESQAWQAAIREATRRPDPAIPTTTLPERPRPGSASSLRRGTWSPVAVVASIALAFLAGRATLGPWSPGEWSPRDWSTGNRPLLGQRTPYANPRSPHDPSVTLANHGLLDGQLAIEPHTLDSLHKLGVQVSQDVGYFSGRTEDGKPVIFPVQNVRLTPTHHPPY